MSSYITKLQENPCGSLISVYQYIINHSIDYSPINTVNKLSLIMRYSPGECNSWYQLSMQSFLTHLLGCHKILPHGGAKMSNYVDTPAVAFSNVYRVGVWHNITFVRARLAATSGRNHKEYIRKFLIINFWLSWILLKFKTLSVLSIFILIFQY